ncbi:hypothetical protein Q9L58_005501 [Maublancomyces gigas]|uniref:Uncharacterized protein n=1 Tax=Discina gigas TaxID=1032678 RepID=A0ABR3GI32_9PEZI
MADTHTPGSDPPTPGVANTSPEKNSKVDFWYAVFQCMDGNPKVDFDKLAEKCNYKNAATARATYNQRRNKLIQSNGTEASPTAGGAKRGRKPKDSSVDVDGETAKKKRGPGRKPKPAGTATDKPAKKRGRPAKKATPTPPPEVGGGAQELEAEEQDTEVDSD